MKKITTKVIVTITIAMLFPTLSHAQGVADSIHSLQGVLDNVYNQMMPKCAYMIDASRCVAGFAALLFIANKVWKHLANAEPIDFYPLLRPFGIGLCITLFPFLLNVMNGVLQPVLDATNNMAGDSNKAITALLDPNQQNNATSVVPPMNGDPDKWYQYSQPTNPNTGNVSSGNAVTAPIMEAFSGWSIKNMIKKAISEILNVCFEAAALVIDTIRTFKLIVLAILGPLCFGLSVFDGFQHTLKQWLARYVNVWMWLPVANIFGAIIGTVQENMIRLEQAGGSADPFFKDTNTAYMIFLIIGIVGYFTVPSIANYIINVGGHALLNKTTALMSSAISLASTMTMQSMMFNSNQLSQTKTTGSSTNTSGNTGSGGTGSHLNNKISGET